MKQTLYLYIYFLNLATRASSDNSYSCFGVRGRNNANGVDLNRNFPSWKDQEAASTRLEKLVRCVLRKLETKNI